MARPVNRARAWPFYPRAGYDEEMRSPLWLLALAALAFLPLTCGVRVALAAMPVKGPGVAVEQANDDEATRRRYEASLLVPVPAQILGGMLVVKGDLFKERRTATADDGTRVDAENDVENPAVVDAGL